MEYKPLVDGAIDLSSHKVSSVILYQRPQCQAELIEGRDFDWEAENAKASPADIVPVKSEDPAYILYTSGTTGTPKGVIRSTAGHIVALKWSMENIYNCRPGDVYWAASDVGWVGHSYIVYAPLFMAAQLFCLGSPSARLMLYFLAGYFEHKVRSMFTPNSYSGH